MSDLTFQEKSKFERLLEMSSGYVLNFTNRSFEQFFSDAGNIAIYGPRFAAHGDSKANRLRSFWQVESNGVVAAVMEQMLELVREERSSDEPLFMECESAIQRLKGAQIVIDVDAIAAKAGEADLEPLVRSVREAITRGEPEAGLDRLHTFLVKYVRRLCTNHGLSTNREKPLHSLFGEYVKHLRAEDRIESEMTDRILKSTISVLDAFNDVRNERSLAHDNPLLNRAESVLILNHVASSIRFLQVIEGSGGCRLARQDTVPT